MRRFCFVPTHIFASGDAKGEVRGVFLRSSFGILPEVTNLGKV